MTRAAPYPEVRAGTFVAATSSALPYTLAPSAELAFPAGTIPTLQAAYAPTAVVQDPLTLQSFSGLQAIPTATHFPLQTASGLTFSTPIQASPVPNQDLTNSAIAPSTLLAATVPMSRQTTATSISMLAQVGATTTTAANDPTTSSVSGATAANNWLVGLTCLNKFEDRQI